MKRHIDDSLFIYTRQLFLSFVRYCLGEKLIRGRESSTTLSIDPSISASFVACNRRILKMFQANCCLIFCFPIDILRMILSQ